MYNSISLIKIDIHTCQVFCFLREATVFYDYFPFFLWFKHFCCLLKYLKIYAVKPAESELQAPGENICCRQISILADNIAWFYGNIPFTGTIKSFCLRQVFLSARFMFMYILILHTNPENVPSIEYPSYFLS